jgi:hypothetical protein
VSDEVLPGGEDFREKYSMLLLDDQGRFLQPDGPGGLTPVSPEKLPEHLDDRIVLPTGVTDVFVWVHGWQTDRAAAHANAKRMFKAIHSCSEKRKGFYASLGEFVPGFVAVSWPSVSPVLGQNGYRLIRDRAAAMTEDGYAEFFLASLLGYLNPTDPTAGGEHPRTLKSKRGFYVHCLGHSFGGRFLTAAIGAAASPKSKKTLSLLNNVSKPKRKVLSGTGSGGGFSYEVDSAVVFQMAAPNRAFGGQLRELFNKGPLRGPFVATFSGYDKANCMWHGVMERGEEGIGCRGAFEPRERRREIELLSPGVHYGADDFPSRNVVNVDATRLYAHFDPLQLEGAHSDFWYEDSIHLILSVANAVRMS